MARKAMSSGALIRDGTGRVLLVEPTYKPTWEIPGGMVEAGESAAAACARELREELGVDLPVGRLLVVDWARAVPGRGDAVRFVYDGGHLPPGVELRLPAGELASAHFADVAEVERLCSSALAQRVRAALTAVEQGVVVELHDGQP